jgi:hypothetical protein
MATHKYPSLDEYAPQHSLQPSPPPTTNYYSHPAESSSYNYPSTSDYSATPSSFPPQNAPAVDQSKISAPPQEGLFGDMGFLQEAVYTQVGSRIFDNGKQYVDKNFGRFLTLLPLKYYFNVNNRYVFNKIRLLLFPFLHRNWNRLPKSHNEGSNYVPPREDINAPDLYIPVMAFVTYVLLVGFVHGTNLKFTPDVLGYTASTAIGILAFEIITIKFGLYLLNSRTVPVLDLVAYTGYIFVALIVNVFLGFFISGSPYFAASLYTSICGAFFIFRTLSPVVATHDLSGTAHRPYYLFAIPVLHVLIVYFLGVN